MWYFRYVLNLIVHLALVHLIKLLNRNLLVRKGVLDRKYSFILCQHFNKERITHTTFYQILELGRHRCWEQTSSSLFWKFLKNVLHFNFIASLSQYFVCLINNHDFHFLQIKSFSLYQVKQSSWRTNNDICTLILDSLKIIFKLIAPNEICEISPEILFLSFTFFKLNFFLIVILLLFLILKKFFKLK